jgi:hypothetical protein
MKQIRYYILVGCYIGCLTIGVPVVQADTYTITNTVSNTVSTGGNQSVSGTDGAPGAAGEDGAPGQDGQSINTHTVPAFQHKTHIQSDVNGVSVHFYDFNRVSASPNSTTSVMTATNIPSSTATMTLVSGSSAGLRTELLSILRNLLTTYVNALR